jgi:hypothetical protein
MLCREDAMGRTGTLMRKKVVYGKDRIMLIPKGRRLVIYRRPWLLASVLLVLLLLLLVLLLR